MQGFGAILAAAKNNRADEITSLLANGMSVNATNQIGQGALHVAAIWGCAEASQVLLDSKADPNVTNQFGVTPLHYAAQNTKYEVAKLLIANRARTDIQAQNGCYAYQMAKEDEMRSLCGGPSLAMHRCIRERDLNQLQELVADGYDVSERDPEGNTALHAAVASAIADNSSSSGSSASASSADSLAIVAAVLAAAAGKGASSLSAAQHMHSTAGLLPLHLAASAGQVSLVGALLSAGAPVSARTRLRGHMFNGEWSRRATDGSLVELTSDDKTALHLALDFLEQNDDDDDDDDDDAEVEGGRKAGLQLVKVLLAHGAEVNATDKDMGTPLHQAISEGMHEVAELLLAANADPRLGCKSIGMENTCLHQATIKGDTKMIALLLAQDANTGELVSGGRPATPTLDVNAPGRDGWTPLCLAARSGCVAAAKALLAAGATPDFVMAPSGNTALDIAAVNKKLAMVALLEAAKAD